MAHESFIVFCVRDIIFTAYTDTSDIYSLDKSFMVLKNVFCAAI